MKERILAFLQAEQISSTQFADRIGVQRSSVSHVLSGRNNPGFDFIRKMMIAFPLVNAEWLMLGKGGMYKSGVHAGLFDTPEEGRPGLDTGKAEEADIVTGSDLAEERKEKQPDAKIKRTAKKVVIFYSDNTFSEYGPAEGSAAGE